MTDECRRTGFLEQSPGNRSSTRLVMVWLTVLATVLVATIVFYVVYCLKHEKALDQYVILALVAGLGAVVLNGAVAIAKRNTGDTPS